MKEDINNLISTINIFQWLFAFIILGILAVLSLPVIILVEMLILMFVLYCAVVSGISSIYNFFKAIL